MPGRDSARQPASGPVPGAGRARPGEGPPPLCRRCPKRRIQAVSPQAQPPRSPPPPPAQRASVLCRSLETGGRDGRGPRGSRSHGAAGHGARASARSVPGPRRPSGPRGPHAGCRGAGGRAASLPHSPLRRTAAASSQHAEAPLGRAPVAYVMESPHPCSHARTRAQRGARGSEDPRVRAERLRV